MKADELLEILKEDGTRERDVAQSGVVSDKARIITECHQEASQKFRFQECGFRNSPNRHVNGRAICKKAHRAQHTVADVSSQSELLLSLAALRVF